MRTEIPAWVADEERKISSLYPREVQSLRDALARRIVVGLGYFSENIKIPF